MLALSACFLLSPAAAQPLSSPRVAQHYGYTRIVFDWDAPVTYSAEIVGMQLLVRFDRKVEGDLTRLTQPLGKLTRGVSVSADGMTVAVALTRPMTVKSFVGNNNSVVIDLQEAAPPPSDKGVAEALIDARSSDHGSFVRLVFDWPASVGYGVSKQGTHATISFSKPGRVDLGQLQSELPVDIKVTEVAGAKTLTIALQVPADSRLRHFASGNKVVVDLVRATGSAAPDGSGKVPLAPPPDADIMVPALQPLTKQEKPKTPEEALKSGPSPVKPIPEPKAKPHGPPTPEAAPSEHGQEAAGPALAAPKDEPANNFAVSVPMTKPTAAAIFQRAGYLWLVFDRRQEADTALMLRQGGAAVRAVEQLPNKDATVLRMVVEPDYYPGLRKEGLLWVIDLTHHFSKPKDIIPVSAPAQLPAGIGMSLKVGDVGSVVSVTDPEVGDSFKVVPVITAGQGIYPGRDTPDLELLPTTQGIAIVPHVDGLDVRSTRGGVTIGMQSGTSLRFSSELDTAPKESLAGSSLFDIASWKRGGPAAFEPNRKIINQSLIGVSASKRALANMQAARFYFANGFGSEALGFMHLAALDQPDLALQPGFTALKGAAELLMGQVDLATQDLDNKTLESDPEVQMWRGAAHSATLDQPAAWDKKMAAGLPLLRPYPHRLKWLLASLAAKSAVAAGDDQAAQQALDVLDREDASPTETAQRSFLHGAYEQMAGHFQKALDDYDDAIDGPDRQYRALAKFAEIDLQLHTRKITPKEAADQLDKLRFAWREQSFEFNLLLRYAELQREAGDLPSALRALRSLVDYYPDAPGTPKAQKTMSEIFSQLYIDGAADALPPVSAIALFDEFRELTPTGPAGDDMIKKLADRLAKVDLLDRAADLLKHQIAFRLQGLDRARVGAQLAVLDLLNQQPQAALDGLAASQTVNLPDDLAHQRRHLQARALSDLGRTAEAIAALGGDDTPEAAGLRSEIHWKAQDWAGAAIDFEAMLPRPERGAKLDDREAKICLAWATALVLANDERGLASLRRNYGPAIAGSPFQEGFSLLTSALDRDTPNLPEVMGKIKEVEGFKSFLDDYRKRLQSSGLSGIN